MNNGEEPRHPNRPRHPNAEAIYPSLQTPHVKAKEGGGSKTGSSSPDARRLPSCRNLIPLPRVCGGAHAANPDPQPHGVILCYIRASEHQSTRASQRADIG